MTEQLPHERARWLAVNILPHEPALRRWLAMRGVDRGEIDDVVQEGYAVLAAVSDVSHIVSPKAYLFRTAWSLILRQVRRERIVSIETAADFGTLDIEADEPGLERALGSRQELRRLAEAMDCLPDRCRDVFMLRKIDGLSQRQVAEQTGLSESTVEKHVAKAVRLLGQWLATEGAEPRPSDDGPGGGMKGQNQ